MPGSRSPRSRKPRCASVRRTQRHHPDRRGRRLGQDYPRRRQFEKRRRRRFREAQLKIGGRNMPGTIVAENRQIHVPDLDNVDPAIADWPGLPHARAAGTRIMCGTPLRREGKAIGVLIVYRDRLAAVHRRGNGAAAELRRSGRHRHRECAAVQRGPGQNARSDGIAGAADRDIGDPERHQQLRAATWRPVFDAMLGKRHAALRR